MRLKSLICVATLGLILGLAPCLTAQSQEQSFSAVIGAKAKTSDVNGSDAKFHEYSDNRSTGVFGDVDAVYDSPGFYLNFSAKDPGYDTQHYRLEGGPYGMLKFWLDYNEIIHNIASDARSFYRGVGSNAITGRGSATDGWNNWSQFNYYTKRNKFDTGLDVKVLKPFFFNAGFSHEEKEGVRATGTQGGVSIEIPEPVHYRTNNLKLEGGYAKSPFFLAFSYAYSDFNNRDNDLMFTDESGAFPGSGGRFYSLPPDNSVHKLALSGSVKLPLHSKFSMNVSDARTSSETTSYATFDGRVDTRNLDLVFTSNPLRFLDAKIYYKYYDRDNKSSSERIPNVFGGADVMTNPLNYTNYTFGAELGVKLPAKFHLTGGYKNVEIRKSLEDNNQPSATLRARNTFPYNTDNIYFVDLKWSGLEFMTARVGYESLARGADYRYDASRNYAYRNFADSAQDRDTFKASIDLAPSDDLNLSFEYDYKRSRYNNMLYGVTSDKRNAFSFSGDYAFRKYARLSAYFDGEKAYLEQTSTQNLAAGSRWESTLEEITYGYGMKADVYAIPKKLTLTFQGDYLRSNGKNDLDWRGTTANYLGAFSLPAGTYSLPIDIPNVDSYQKYTLGFVAAYNWSDALTIRAGYAYDRYNYSDSQVNGYQYIVRIPSTGVTTGYLSGADANPQYSVNTVFVGLTYRFK